jgi:hypothetical protein
MPTSAGGNYAGPLRMNKRQTSVIHPRNVALCRRCGRRHRKSSDSQFVAQVVAPLTRHYHRAAIVAILRQRRQPHLDRYSSDGDLEEAEIGAADGLFKPKASTSTAGAVRRLLAPVARRSAGRSKSLAESVWQRDRWARVYCSFGGEVEERTPPICRLLRFAPSPRLAVPRR